MSCLNHQILLEITNASVVRKCSKKPEIAICNILFENLKKVSFLDAWNCLRIDHCGVNGVILWHSGPHREFFMMIRESRSWFGILPKTSINKHERERVNDEFRRRRNAKWRFCINFWQFYVKSYWGVLQYNASATSKMIIFWIPTYYLYI